MKAYVVESPGKTAYWNIGRPEPGPYEALVKIELCVVCNTTDRMVIDGTFPAPATYPCVLGHESIGTVVKVGDQANSFKIGDRVTRAGYRAESAPPPLYSRWGGFAEYGIVEDIASKRRDGLTHGYANQAPQVIPDDIPLKDAALMISLGETASFTRLLGDMAGRKVVVIGTGIAGYGIAFFAKHFGAAEVTVVGRRDDRLDLAKKLGADRTVNISVAASSPGVGSHFADYLVDASGNRQALLNTLRYLKNGGTVGLYGVADKPYEFPLNEGPARFRIEKIPPNEAEIIPYLIAMSRKGQLPSDLLVTHEWTFSELDDAFEQVSRGDVVKGIVWIDRPRT